MSEIKVNSVVNSTGDNDSGLDLSTNDQVDIKIAGSVKARVNSSGNLDVSGTIDADDKITIAYEAGSSNWELESTSGDDFSVSRNGSETFLLDGSTSYPHFRGASQVRLVLGSAGTEGTNNSNWIRASGNQVDLNTNGGGYGFEVSGNTQLLIATNGAVTSQAGTYGSISDQTLKENIADANSQWDDIKALRIRNYSMISDSLDTADKIGVIAQELESAGMNGLVEETNWRNQTVKSVKQSILYMKAVKALQEAMTRIETLEAKVTALENAE